MTKKKKKRSSKKGGVHPVRHPPGSAIGSMISQRHSLSTLSTPWLSQQMLQTVKLYIIRFKSVENFFIEFFTNEAEFPDKILILTFDLKFEGHKFHCRHRIGLTVQYNFRISTFWHQYYPCTISDSLDPITRHFSRGQWPLTLSKSFFPTMPPPPSHLRLFWGKWQPLCLFKSV